MITVAEVTQPEQLEEYRTLWRSLHQRTPGAALLQSREALEYYARTHTEEVSLRMLVVHVGMQPIGILPLVCRQLPTRLGTLRALTYPTFGAFRCAGPIGPNSTATLVGAFQHLAATPRDWDVIDLRGIDALRDHGRTRNAFQIAGMAAIVRNWSTHAVLRRSELGVSEQYQRRTQLREAERQLWKSGSWVYQHLAGEELTLSADFDNCWRSIEPVVAETERTSLRDMAWIAAQSGQLSCQIMRIQGRVVAYLLATLIGESLQPLEMLCQPGHSGAADVLFGKLLYDDFCSGTPEFTCGPQFVSQAVRWGAQPHLTHRYTYFSAYRPKAQMLRLAQWIKPMTTTVDVAEIPNQVAPAEESLQLHAERRQLRISGRPY